MRNLSLERGQMLVWNRHPLKPTQVKTRGLLMAFEEISQNLSWEVQPHRNWKVIWKTFPASCWLWGLRSLLTAWPPSSTFCFPSVQFVVQVCIQIWIETFVPFNFSKGDPKWLVLANERSSFESDYNQLWPEFKILSTIHLAEPWQAMQEEEKIF